MFLAPARSRVAHNPGGGCWACGWMLVKAQSDAQEFCDVSWGDLQFLAGGCQVDARVVLRPGQHAFGVKESAGGGSAVSLGGVGARGDDLMDSGWAQPVLASKILSSCSFEPGLDDGRVPVLVTLGLVSVEAGIGGVHASRLWQGDSGHGWWGNGYGSMARVAIFPAAVSAFEGSLPMRR